MTNLAAAVEELKELMRLSKSATQGYWNEDEGGDVVRDDGTTIFSRQASECGIPLDESFANTTLTVQAVNVIKIHGETILAELGRGASVPAGWVLVPIEPTWDMRNEGREFLIDGLEKDYEKIAYFLWKTMVNASPKAPDTRPPVAGLAELTSGWLPVSEPPKTNSICLVYWRDEEGDRFDFEYYEDDCWNNHSSNYEHYMAVGGSQAGGPDCICTGPSEDAPYTHWKYVTPPSEEPAREFLGKVDG